MAKTTTVVTTTSEAPMLDGILAENATVPADMVTVSSLMFTASEASGAPIEFLRTGTFIDMHGRKVTIDESLLDGLVANFTAGAAGQEVPVDILHQQAEAAGWIQSVWRDGDRMFASADWNELGVNLVRGKIYRYLSATIDLGNRILRSVSLCNFPAVKGLAPVSLKEMMFLDGESLGERMDRVRMGYEQDFLDHKTDKYVAPEEYYEDEEPAAPWVLDVWDTYVIVYQKDRFWKVNYTSAEDGKLVFDHDNAVEVKRDWVEAQEATKLGTTSTIVFRSRRHTANLVKEIVPMSEEIQEQPVADLQEKTIVAAPAPAPVEPDIDREALVAEMRADLKAAMDRELAEFRASLSTAVATLGAERTNITQQVMREVQEAQELALFAHRVTATGQYALPVTRDEVMAILQSLPTAARETVKSFIETVHRNGTVDFREIGTTAAPKVESTKRRLDPLMEQQLRMFTSNGGTREMFFELNKDILGDVAQYEVEA